jgi:hypothetical protein
MNFADTDATVSVRPPEGFAPGARLPNMPSMPGLQPFFAQVLDANLEQGGSGAQLAVVPAAKILIIEDVTVALGVTPGAPMEFSIEVFRPDKPDDPPRYYKIPLIQRHAFSDEDSDLLVGGRRVRWYIEQGLAVCYTAQGEKATTGRISVTVSGRFVDVMRNRLFTNLRSAFRSFAPWA